MIGHNNLSSHKSIEEQSFLISVIIPFYNRISQTIEAVNSVLSQTYQNFEIILVNDGSTEDITPLTSLDDPRIKILHQYNHGPASARNHGMREAKGDYIAFLDSDDLFMPTKLMRQLAAHLDNPEVAFSHTSYRFFDSEGLAEVINSGTFSGFVYPDIFFDCPIASPTVMFKHAIAEQNMFMNENYKVAEDVIFYAGISRLGRIIGIDVPLALVRRSPSFHASSKIAQIVGAMNILHYLHDFGGDIPNSQRREIYFQKLKYIGYNYRLLKNIPLASYYYLSAFWYLDGKISYLIGLLKKLARCQACRD